MEQGSEIKRQTVSPFFSVSCSSIPANLPKGPLSTQCPGLGTFEVLRAAWTGLPPDPALSHILPTIYGRRWHRKALSCFPQDLNPPSVRRCIFGYTVLLIGPSHRAQPLARRISWAVKVVFVLVYTVYMTNQVGYRLREPRISFQRRLFPKVRIGASLHARDI